MVVPSKAGEAPVKRIDVWANQSQKSASLLGMDSPLFGAPTIGVSVCVQHPVVWGGGGGGGAGERAVSAAMSGGDRRHRG